MGCGHFGHLLRPSFGHDLPAGCTAFWAKVDDPIGGFDDVQIVLDHHQCVAGIDEFVEDGKEALSSMTPAQIVAMSAIGQAPAILTPMLRMQGIVRPPYNVIISNVPGPRTTHYWNGAKMVGTYPLSIPINGMALNITCTSYDGKMGFGLTGCRRTVPHLQHLLTYLDDELKALEKVAGV